MLNKISKKNKTSIRIYKRKANHKHEKKRKKTQEEETDKIDGLRKTTDDR